MAEMDTLEVYNPLTEDFQVRFNGEMYTLPAESTKSYPQFLAFHVAKHLSDALLKPELARIQKLTKENAYNPAVAQLNVYDNIHRRMALYDVLKSKTLVEQCIAAFPFKSYIGEVAAFDEYIAKKEKKVVKSADKE